MGLGSVFWKLITTFFQIIEFFKNKEAVALSTLSWPLVLLLSAFPSFHGLKLLPRVAPSLSPLSDPLQQLDDWGSLLTPPRCDVCVTPIHRMDGGQGAG